MNKYKDSTSTIGKGMGALNMGTTTRTRAQPRVTGKYSEDSPISPLKTKAHKIATGKARPPTTTVNPMPVTEAAPVIA